MKCAGLSTLSLSALLATSSAPPRAQASLTAVTDIILKPTDHPPLPRDVSQFWLAPAASTRSVRGAALNDFLQAVKYEVAEDYARALPLLSQAAVQQGVLGDYALYYRGFAELRLARAADAKQTFQ